MTSGDVWAKAGVQNFLRMLELTGHQTVPVAMGAEFPLINTREETRMWEDQFGEFGYKGAWNAARYRDPNDVPTPAAGATGRLSMSGVSTAPGRIAQTRTPLWCSSNARPWASARTPAFVA